MRLFTRIATQPASVMLGFVLASGLFLAVFGLALFTGRILASHDDPNVVHACANRYTSQARFIAPYQAPNCNAYEWLIELAGPGMAVDVSQLQADLDALGGQVDDLATENEALQTALDTLEAQVPDCLSDDSGTALFTGCNVQVVNGDPSNSTSSTNGTGNLIIGYNENLLQDFLNYERTGSHNLVVGSEHGYSSYGGLVAGSANQITAPSVSVSGGIFNTASGTFSSVSGGQSNEASGASSSISGGSSNEATGANASVTAGEDNIAMAGYSSVTGGQGNRANGDYSSVSGGNSRTAPNASNWVAGELLEAN